MSTFVMGDIHGAYPALMQCLARSGFNHQEDVLIQLGDITDRHKDVFECVEELLKIKHLITLKGNHDDWFLSFMEQGIHPEQWKMGGKATALSYLKHAGKQSQLFPSKLGFKTTLEAADIPMTHQHFFKEMRLYYLDESNRCFVHGGFDRNRPFLHQESAEYYWNRSLWTEALAFEAFQRETSKKLEFGMVDHFRRIFIGHTNLMHWHTDQPMLAANVWNIDTGAGHRGRLTIMNVDTEQYWQSDPVSELYD